MARAFSSEIRIGERAIGPGRPTYFVADIAANHDGDLQRALALIDLAAEAGADAAKFQHFQAATIVSDVGFRSLGSQRSHQAAWNRSVFDVYQDASLDLDWTPRLEEHCRKVGITFMTSPYAPELVDFVDPYVPAYKIGSGDVTWLEQIEHIARKGKPVLLATGASTADEVERAVATVLAHTGALVLMQCNTNYTGSRENFRCVQLRVLGTFAHMYPGMLLGFSDHTPGHSAVLGAVALGARVIEKHFTDDTRRSGPDHGFAMDPRTWREMVERTRELELALGDGVKRIEENERETVVLQRRSLRAARDLAPGTVLERAHLSALRPCPAEAIAPDRLGEVLGKRLRSALLAGSALRWTDLE